ncbi:MAG: hypothetical protein ACLUQJ_06370, partial [Alphaproteobacteria bacterium]
KYRLRILFFSSYSLCSITRYSFVALVFINVATAATRGFIRHRFGNVNNFFKKKLIKAEKTFQAGNNCLIIRHNSL